MRPNPILHLIRCLLCSLVSYVRIVQFGLSLKEFSEYTRMPKRHLEDWLLNIWLLGDGNKPIWNKFTLNEIWSKASALFWREELAAFILRSCMSWGWSSSTRVDSQRDSGDVWGDAWKSPNGTEKADPSFCGRAEAFALVASVCLFLRACLLVLTAKKASAAFWRGSSRCFHSCWLALLGYYLSFQSHVLKKENEALFFLFIWEHFC